MEYASWILIVAVIAFLALAMWKFFRKDKFPDVDPPAGGGTPGKPGGGGNGESDGPEDNGEERTAPRRKGKGR